MSDKLLDKYTRKDAFPALAASDADLELSEGCFGWLRGIRDRAISLELRKKDGQILAMGYGWLSRMEYDPDRGITLHYPDLKVMITGTGLNAESRPTVRLFEGITRHRVPWIRECEAGEYMALSTRLTKIDSIQWER